MKRYFCAALLAASLGFAVSAQAADDKRGGWLVNLDLDYGGDDVATVFFEDDDTQNVKAGQGMAFRGRLLPPDRQLALRNRGQRGLQVLDHGGVQCRHRREPHDAAARVCRIANEWYLGGGLLRHMSPKVDGDGFFEDIDFDDAMGFNLEIGWRWIALHYTDMTYESDLYEDVDASHFGVRFTYRYGQH